jgi:WD40 repeat protein
LGGVGGGGGGELITNNFLLFSFLLFVTFVLLATSGSISSRCLSLVSQNFQYSQCIGVFTGQQDVIWDICLHKDLILYSGSDNGRLIAWNAQTCQVSNFVDKRGLSKHSIPNMYYCFFHVLCVCSLLEQCYVKAVSHN